MQYEIWSNIICGFKPASVEKLSKEFESFDKAIFACNWYAFMYSGNSLGQYFGVAQKLTSDLH